MERDTVFIVERSIEGQEGVRIAGVYEDIETAELVQAAIVKADKDLKVEVREWNVQ